MGGWVGWVEGKEAVGMSYCEREVGWVGGWVGRTDLASRTSDKASRAMGSMGRGRPRRLRVGGWVGGWVGRTDLASSTSDKASKAMGSMGRGRPRRLRVSTGQQAKYTVW